MSQSTNLMTEPISRGVGRDHRIWISLILFVLFLSGCSSQDESKSVFKINVRSSRVEAQSTSYNLYAANAAAPRGLPATATPLPPNTPTPAPDALADAMPTETPPTKSLAPQPIAVPIGRPERIVVPAVAIDTDIVPVYSQENQMGNVWFQNWSTASYAAGYHEGSALLGQDGNTVISGHNNIEGSVFGNLYQIQPGAEIYLYAHGYRYDYIVEDAFIVSEMGAPLEQRLQNASWIGTTIDERVTLVSCWPPEGNAYRVIVVARPVGKSE